MKTGRIGKFTLALAGVIIVMFFIRAWLVPTIEQILITTPDIKENPQLSNQVPDFSSISDIPTKKQTFFDYMTPAVKHQNAIISAERKFLIVILNNLRNGQPLTDADIFKLQKLTQKYRYQVKKFDLITLTPLLERVDTLPVKMVLIQAANETGWGSSRFATEGNNYFGQWCFSKGCGLVPQSRTPGLNHEVASFDTPEDSIAAYLLNLNTNSAYHLLRSIRADLRAQDIEPTAEELVFGLLHYSERKHEYIDELLQMMRHNKNYLAGL
ncbi:MULTISPECIES: glucosaminidase domain-containing protein [unclassified Shewanella]|uniref:glucosaminidase domain-containing protein n=1 Tax=unclassified Shewanella TaxID=196818 RepID=UPI000C853C94|nr:MULTISPECIES: glucosaminidase domain-containing protein [unclassified Shewanella]MDO6618295.1 glucosaminidase domain-containing protein [Shewanella sp. 6_MG-2023]MDO6641593.1 glucosaminidase domain-containing protein [Shewanella sp. 5_MG-2023]PMG28434.1 glucosaminidase [Shewanella sp. 10N.286.52.C2]PMG47584.1 glucosaminidase [Shewanella sp. 10N.286.52.B9]PMH89311.1 glucosaminidase [Shewanella sp. 10N.286.48.B5]